MKLLLTIRTNPVCNIASCSENKRKIHESSDPEAKLRQKNYALA
jgi:hypothetical protein